MNIKKMESLDDHFINMVRRAVLNGHSSEILGLLLTKEQVALVESIPERSNTTTSASLAEGLGVSIQNASAKLKVLSDRGYLLRVMHSAESGGREAHYTPVFYKTKV